MLVNQCWHSLTPMVPVDEILYTQRGISPHFRTDPRPFAVLFEGLNTWQVHREEPASDHESVEHEEATDRFYSQDDIKRALAILNLESLPTETRLKRTFRKKAVDCHPDKVPPQRRAWATEEMQRVNWAYKLLLAKINGVAPSAPAQLRMLTCS